VEYLLRKAVLNKLLPRGWSSFLWMALRSPSPRYLCFEDTSSFEAATGAMGQIKFSTDTSHEHSKRAESRKSCLEYKNYKSGSSAPLTKPFLDIRDRPTIILSWNYKSAHVLQKRGTERTCWTVRTWAWCLTREFAAGEDLSGMYLRGKAKGWGNAHMFWWCYHELVCGGSWCVADSARCAWKMRDW